MTTLMETMQPPRRMTLLSIFIASLFLVTALAVFDGPVAAANSNQSTLNNVQVTIQPTVQNLDYYVTSAYNTTGGLVASYQSEYAASSFELPTGTYIFTVDAIQQGSYGTCPICMVSAGSSSSSNNATTFPGAVIAPCCSQSEVEYGYAVQAISGPTSLTIATKPANETDMSTLTIDTNYPNGTAAAGVSISASVLGDSYNWAGEASNTSLYNTTGSNGVATLVIPTAPVLVSASISLPINLPQNDTTVQVTVAGETINVTLDWQPTYVTFANSVLIVPPQTSVGMTLEYQQQSTTCAIPLTSAQSSTSTGAASGSVQVVCPGVSSDGDSSAQASSVTAQASASTDLGQAAPPSQSTGPSEISVVLLFVGAAGLAVIGMSLFVVARVKRKKEESALSPASPSG